MNKTLVGVVGFIFGAASGSAAMWYYVKDKYEKIAQEEIEEVRDFYRSKDEAPGESKSSENETKENVDLNIKELNAYKRLVKNVDYSTCSKQEKTKNDIPEPKKEDEKKTDPDVPYVISPDEFGEFDDYEKISLMFFSDHILTDEEFEKIEDVDKIVGFDSLNHFGEYEDDSVYVRNDQLKCDYEILMDLRKYSDVLKEKPYLRGVL